MYSLTMPSNPTIAAYLAKTSVKVGEIWTIPVNTGSASDGVTGQVTLTFQGLEDLTTSAGTFKVFKIEISSGTLTMHSAVFDSGTMQINGSTYLEQGTCRLIKTDVTHQSIIQSGITTTRSTIVTEKTLTEYSAK